MSKLERAKSCVAVILSEAKLQRTDEVREVRLSMSVQHANSNQNPNSFLSLNITGCRAGVSTAMIIAVALSARRARCLLILLAICRLFFRGLRFRFAGAFLDLWCVF